MGRINQILSQIWGRLERLYWAALGNSLLVNGTLSAKLIRAGGQVVNYGVIARRVVTTAGVNFLVDAFQGTTEPELFKYHASGTDATAEAITDTALGAEVGSRETGTQAEGASANIYKSVATITYGGSYTIREHGIFNSATPAGSVCLDRSMFAAISVVSGDAIQFTYELTCTAGG